jgi:diaminopimelate decarboxylase
MLRAGLKPSLLNIGGGYPVVYTKPIPSIETIGDIVNQALADLVRKGNLTKADALGYSLLQEELMKMV